MSEQRVAVVTGAAGGVGGKLVRSLAATGWKVFAVARDAGQVDELNAIDGVEAYVLDLLDSANLTAWAEALVEDKAPCIDLVAHVAAVAPVGPAAGSDTQTDAYAENECRGAGAAERRTAAGGTQGPGTIVFVNSGPASARWSTMPCMRRQSMRFADMRTRCVSRNPRTAFA